MEKDDQVTSAPASRATLRESAASASCVEMTQSSPAIMVVIANYGTDNDVYMRRLLQEFRSMDSQLSLHVVTNIQKDWGPDVTTHVGLPTRNPCSLPYAHRRLFAEKLSSSDYFIYCEDDTLITARNIKAFLEVNALLKPDEIAGFLRVECISPEVSYVESAHGPYRWLPSSIVRRGSLDFASFTNFHSAFTIASRAQIQKAIDSGGFLVGPHIGRFGMLECAASDIYTQCGMTRLICLSRMEDFVVPHLSNKNSLRWGLPREEFDELTHSLERIAQNGSWKGSLFEVDTRMPRGMWSKNLYERPDEFVLGMLPGDAKTVLSIGSGWGATEEFLAKRGKKVTALPVDGVFADCARRRNIEVVEGSIETALASLGDRRFDCVLMLDMIHLLPDPTQWLSRLRQILSPSGGILVSVPRTFDPLRISWYLRGEPAAVFPKDFAHSGVQKVTRRRLLKWFTAAGLTAQVCATCNTPTRLGMLAKMQGVGDHLLADRFIVRARSKVNI